MKTIDYIFKKESDIYMKCHDNQQLDDLNFSCSADLDIPIQTKLYSQELQQPSNLWKWKKDQWHFEKLLREVKREMGSKKIHAVWCFNFFISEFFYVIRLPTPGNSNSVVIPIADGWIFHLSSELPTHKIKLSFE